MRTSTGEEFSFVKLEGKRVSDGTATIADVRDFLDGIEKATKYFIGVDYPGIAKNSYEIEVRIEPGSLVAYLVGLAATGTVSVMAAFGIAYAKKAGEQLAANDVGDKTSAEILGSAMRKMKATARIAKHVGGMGKQRFPNIKVVSKEDIFVYNDSGEELQVTKQELDVYSRAPKDVFKKMVSAVNNKTELFLGESGETVDSKSIIRISPSNAHYFGAQDAVDDGIVFPAWQHGERLVLRGALCRANTNTGTLGFVYDGHTITSYLHQMEIQNIKDSLFDKEVEVEARVIRTQQKMDAEDELKKPKLEIRKITTLGDLNDRHANASLLEIEPSYV